MSSLIEEIKILWDECEVKNAEVFRYKVNITRDKVLEGNFKFYVQVKCNQRIFIIDCFTEVCL